jgi:hypothetical protein
MSASSAVAGCAASVTVGPLARDNVPQSAATTHALDTKAVAQSFSVTLPWTCARSVDRMLWLGVLFGPSFILHFGLRRGDGDQIVTMWEDQLSYVCAFT